jgi:hypothetical protein
LPNPGRFISEDPGGFRGGVDLYEYVHANPIQGRDPTGHGDHPGRPTYCPGASPKCIGEALEAWTKCCFRLGFNLCEWSDQLEVECNEVFDATLVACAAQN